MQNYDVVIAGGGLAGASLACALAPAGLRIAVVEAVPLKSESQPSYDDRIIALAYGSQRILAGLGVWPEIAARDATPIERIHVSDRGHFGIARLTREQAGTEALGYVVPTRVLGEALYAFLAARTQVTMLCPAQVSALKTGGRAAGVTVRSDAGETRLNARLVVIADGGRSQLRELAGIRAQVRDYHQTAILSTVTPELPHRNTAYERFTETGPLAFLPTRKNRFALVWTARRDEVDALMALSDQEFLDRLQARFGYRAGRLSRLGRRNAYPLQLVRISDPVAPRVVAVGNAAHAIHPIAGQGFNLGLRDVAALAEVIHDAHRAGLDIGGDALLTGYAQWRRRDTRATIAFTDGLVRVFSNDFAPAVVMRGLGLLAVDNLPFVKRLLMRQAMGLTGKTPRLSRGLGLA